MRYVAFLAVLGVIATAPALAIQIPNETPHAAELSVWQVYNNLYGTSYTSNVDLDVMRIVDLQTFFIPDGEGLQVEAQARYASVLSDFGYYTPAGAPTDYNVLFSVTEIGDLSGSGYTATIDFDGWFGFFLDPAGEGAIWHSEQSLNWLGEDHMVAYMVEDQPGVILLAWEDLPLPGYSQPYDYLYGGSTLGSSAYDADYNDLIVELRFFVIPEPATMLLFGLGIAGMAVRRFAMA